MYIIIIFLSIVLNLLDGDAQYVVHAGENSQTNAEDSEISQNNGKRKLIDVFIKQHIYMKSGHRNAVVDYFQLLIMSIVKNNHLVL